MPWNDVISIYRTGCTTWVVTYDWPSQDTGVEKYDLTSIRFNAVSVCDLIIVLTDRNGYR